MKTYTYKEEKEQAQRCLSHLKNTNQSFCYVRENGGLVMKTLGDCYRTLGYTYDEKKQEWIINN